jgi:polyhydroxyalkanoic acid synthase PhaR subunit
VTQSAEKLPPKAGDPFELWRQVYEANERAWNAALERTLSSPAFAEAQGKLMETLLAAQKTARENMRTYLEMMNVPTREDIARVGELIVNLEEKVDQLDDRLIQVEAALQQGTARGQQSTVERTASNGGEATANDRTPPGTPAKQASTRQARSAGSER